MAETKERPLTARVQFVYPDKHQIAFINASRFTHLATDVIMDLGTLDAPAFVKAIQEGAQKTLKKKTRQPEEVAVEATMNYSFGMSFHAFLKLKENIDDMVNQLMSKGLLDPFLPPPQ